MKGSLLSENYLQHADHFSRILRAQEVNKMNNENNNVIEQNFSKAEEDQSLSPRAFAARSI